MRSIEILTTKNEYSPGEVIEGRLILSSDNSFKYNAIHLTFRGREHTQVEVSYGDSTTTYRDERVYFNIRQEIDGPGRMAAGVTEFPFQFTLPENVPSSYSGRNGWIEYTLKAVIEVSWAPDPRKEIVLTVINPTSSVDEVRGPDDIEMQCYSINRGGRTVMDVEVERCRVPLGMPVQFRVQLRESIRLRRVRAQLFTVEIVIAQNQHDTARTLHNEWSVEDKDLPYGIWISGEIPTDDKIPVSIHREILSNEGVLKVILEIPWRRDSWIELPINFVRRCGTSENDWY